MNSKIVNQMEDPVLDWFYSVLKEYDKLDTFFEWAKQEKLLPKDIKLRKKILITERQNIIQAILKFAESNVVSSELRDKICLYR